MATDVRNKGREAPASNPEEPTTPEPEPERTPYRLTADQIFRMVETGIIPDEVDVELWDGVLYRLTKREPHNAVVGQTADLIRALIPAGYRVREEKVCSADTYSLPEPDIAVHKGGPWDFIPNPPPLAKLALLVEVNQSSAADYHEKLEGYARGGVPVYWVVDLRARRVTVFTRPLTGDAGPSRYGESRTFTVGEAVPVVIADQARGTIPVADLFPPESRV